MMETITQFFGRKITSDALDIRLGQAVCFIGGVLMLVVSMWKLTQLDLNEAQLFGPMAARVGMFSQ